ncbi:MAG TPA: hypothetical protein VFD18_00985 [Chthoniobacterales bacterium]|nr:hypothetical protein [Chthoniobacterales bacterium]
MSALSCLSRRTQKVLRYRGITRSYPLLRLAASLAVLLGATHLQAQSALDGFKVKVNGSVQAVVVQPDGKILIGGSFAEIVTQSGETILRNKLARINPDGTVDVAFDPNANGNILTIAVQADGKVLAGGYFTSIGGQLRNSIARLDATTGMADSFDPNASDILLSIAVQADGKILAAGEFNSIGGETRHNIARLDPITGVADSFNPNANDWVNAVVVQPDGKILVSGWFAGAHSVGGQTRNRIARLDPITGMADSFDPNANNIVHRLALQADGKVLAGGYFTTIGGQTRNRMARLDATTGLADSFDPSPDNELDALAVQPDGKILAGGYFTTIGGATRNYIARFDPITGSLDSFNPDRNAAVFSIAVQADGKILAGGWLDSEDAYAHLDRLERDGRFDQTLDIGISGFAGHVVFVTTVQRDGKILIGGGFDHILGVTRHNIARLNTDGTLDMAFDPNSNNVVRAVAIQADDKIVVGGDFSGPNSIGGQTRNFIARLDPVTGLADSFDPFPINPTSPASTYAIAVQRDGKILVSGNFVTIGGQTRNLFARLDPETGLADSFDPVPNSAVASIALQSDGKICVGGSFDQIGQQIRHHIARLDPTTGIADSFNPNANSSVSTIALQGDGKILVGGDFSGPNSIGGETRNHIARLDPTTGLADSFDPNANNIINSVVLQADGKILVGGNFSGPNSIGGETRNHIARLDPATGLADSFDPNSNNAVFAIAVQTDGKIVVGGFYDIIGGQMRTDFARLTNDTASLQDLVVSRTDITWILGGSNPQYSRVTFESSSDGLNYIFLGEGMAVGDSWTLKGLNLPTGENLYVRAHGYYRGGIDNSSDSVIESVRNAFILRPSTFGNISTRLRVQTGDNAMIGGFIITGTEPKTVIVRGIGPSLPVPGALADPVIEVHGASGELLAANDNWMDDPNQQHVIDSGLAPTNDLESALWGIINPGLYTVVVRGKNDTMGVGLFEVYDLDQTVDSKLANISTRGFVETGNNVMIGGTIIIGNDPARVLLRAIGPSLTNFGVPNALLDPTLELRDANGSLLASNDNWRSDQEAEIIATGIPPSNDLESAIVGNLVPGNYTSIVRGVNDGTGVAVVEAYELN